MADQPTRPHDKIPDVRDGLTREERVVLYVLQQAQAERGGRNVPTAMLWGRVCAALALYQKQEARWTWYS
jgi:hypothetical protein